MTELVHFSTEILKNNFHFILWDRSIILVAANPWKNSQNNLQKPQNLYTKKNLGPTVQDTPQGKEMYTTTKNKIKHTSPGD